MSRIAIATDSNSGITQAQARELGVFVLPMPFYINDELFLAWRRTPTSRPPSPPPATWWSCGTKF